MTQKSYAMHISMILGVSAVLLLFIFVLVAHHRGISDRVRQDSGALRATGSGVVERIKPVGQAGVPAAQTQRQPVKNTVTAPSPGRDGK